MAAAASETLDLQDLQAGLQRCCRAMEAAAPELNALDAQLGDGDLGTTLARCAQQLQTPLATPPASLETLFKACAQGCARASGSSFGTLLAVAFLEAAKAGGPATRLEMDAMAPLLRRIGDALSHRGGARPGDKTMLDSIAAIAGALDAAPATGLAGAARQASRAALEEFRPRPNRIGRARMFAERSVGLDDPGMVAVLRMVEAL